MEHQTDLISESRTYEKYPFDYDPALNGLGGWMILVIIGRLLTFFTYGSAIADLTLFLGYSPEADVYIYIMIALCVLFGIVLTGFILFFIFKRNIIFRKLLVIQIAISLGTTFLICILFNAWSEFTRDIFTGIVGGAIWITYLYRSVRVKNTFIYAHNHYEDESI